MQEIKKLSEREHILRRPAMYIGSTTLTESNEYILENNSIVYKTVKYVPGLIKIINEIIDNSVDVAIKTKFKYSNQINVKIESTRIIIQDNGTGIPVKKSGEYYMPMLAFGHARAGSNFDDINRTQIGMNGIGSFATNVFSKKFIAETDDSNKFYKVTFKNNASSYIENLTESKKKRGTKVTFYPDLEKFNIKEIDEIHQLIIKQRLLNLSMSFPDIIFKFNGKKISASSFKKFVSLFNNSFVEYETENYKFAILPNTEDDFRHYTYVNGLKIPDGGTHIDNVIYNIVQGLREKLQRKYKNIKPGDIRNKLMFVEFIQDFPNPKFNSQSKEKITNSIKEMSDFYGTIDYSKIVNKILRTPEIIDNITEIYRIKEELQKRKDLKSLNKKVKIKSDKYTRPVGNHDVLLVCEGQCLEENTELLTSEFISRKIKDFNVGDSIISREGTEETIKSMSKTLRETVYIKTESGRVECSKKHRWFVYDKNKREFLFQNAEEIVNNYKRYNMVKSKVNENMLGLEVLKNTGYILEFENGSISYTDSDYFLVYDDGKFTRKFSKDIAKNDIVIQNYR